MDRLTVGNLQSRAGLNDVQFAILAGCSPPQVGHLRRGAAPLRRAIAERISAAFNIPVEKLIEDHNAFMQERRNAILTSVAGGDYAR